MNKNISIESRKRRGGFTLIEVIAGLAIVAILAIILAPRVGKFIEKADKTKALDEVRQVVLAIEDYSIENSSKIEESEKFISIKTKLSKVKKDERIVDIKSIKMIDDNIDYSTMLDLISGKKNFTLKNGKINVTT